MARLLALLIKSHKVTKDSIVKMITESKLNTAGFIHILTSQHKFNFETNIILNILLNESTEEDAVAERVGEMIAEDLFDLSDADFVTFVANHKFKYRIVEEVLSKLDSFRLCGTFIKASKLLCDQSFSEIVAIIHRVLPTSIIEELDGSAQEMVQTLGLSDDHQKDLYRNLMQTWSLGEDGKIENTYEQQQSSSGSASESSEDSDENYSSQDVSDEADEENSDSDEENSDSEKRSTKKLNKKSETVNKRKRK